MNFNLSNKSKTIGCITLKKVIPDVFADGTARPLHDASDIWNRDFTFNRGEMYRIQAASGGGKSSLCAFIYGLRHDYHGSIEFDGKDIRNIKSDSLAATRTYNIAYLPQELALFPELTVVENIEIKNSLTNFKTPGQIKDMLGLLGLGEDVINRNVSTLSIGQQQRVAIIRSLCQPFDFLLLDEPVSHLDEKNNIAASNLIESEANIAGAAVITTSVGNHLLINPTKIVRL